MQNRTRYPMGSSLYVSGWSMCGTRTPESASRSRLTRKGKIGVVTDLTARITWMRSRYWPPHISAISLEPSENSSIKKDGVGRVLQGLAADGAAGIADLADAQASDAAFVV